MVLGKHAKNLIQLRLTSKTILNFEKINEEKFCMRIIFYFLLINLTLSELRDYCRQSQMRFSFLLIFPMNENWESRHSPQHGYKWNFICWKYTLKELYAYVPILSKLLHKKEHLVMKIKWSILKTFIDPNKIVIYTLNLFHQTGLIRMFWLHWRKASWGASL